MARKPLEQVSHPLTNQDVQENRNNTSRQLRSMDQQLANDAENTASNNAVQQEEYHKVIFIFNGIRVPVQVDVRSLRQAIGIPNINLDALSNFEETNISRPHVNQEDNDHDVN
jgi:hypothetical protein